MIDKVGLKYHASIEQVNEGCDVIMLLKHYTCKSHPPILSKPSQCRGLDRDDQKLKIMALGTLNVSNQNIIHNKNCNGNLNN